MLSTNVVIPYILIMYTSGRLTLDRKGGDLGYTTLYIV